MLVFGYEMNFTVGTVSLFTNKNVRCGFEMMEVLSESDE